MQKKLRANQKKLQDGIVQAWEKGARCAMPTMATGGGKTLLMAKTIKDVCTTGRGVVQAHRSELVGQLSLALASEGIEHDLTCSKSVQRQIIDNHLDKLGRSFFRPTADWSVESVDTATRREAKSGVKWVVQDEGHHCLRSNKWGKSLAKYPDAKWLLPTATPGRADGMGLGSTADGYVDALIAGPNSALLMAEGFLVTYDILRADATDLDMNGVAIGANGDFNQVETARRVKASNRIVGDAVSTYIEHANGRLCIVFAVDIEHAQTLLKEYLARGVPAELVTGEDLDSARLGALKRFESRQTHVLINVDLFGEGTDVPGVEVVQMCRPTASFPLLCQQVGRMLRLDISPFLMSIWDSLPVAERLQQIAISRKPKALLIDHVGNMLRTYKICGLEYSGPPEGFNGWSLEGKARKSNAGGAIPLRICTGCYQTYERFYNSCPYCGTEAPPPAQRGGPQQIDGSLVWHDPQMLDELRRKIAYQDSPPPDSISHLGDNARFARANWQNRINAQHELRAAIAWWAGHYPHLTDDEKHKRFWFTFGITVVQACALGAGEAKELQARIELEISKQPATH